ncbi:non-ribosomal peptide synthetase [Streptomyces anulatus]
MTIGGELGKNTRDRVVELSPQQRRLWVLHHLFPSLPLYNSPYAYHLTGRVDTALLERAVRAVVRAHESLRTGFPVRGDSPVRLIADTTDFSLPVHELTADSDEVRQAARRVFDLSSPGAFDIRLFRVADDGWVLLVNLHHIITDAVSNQVVIEDIAAAYTALLAGDEPEIHGGTTYSEHAERFAAKLAGGLAERQLDYWAEALDGVPPLLNLPTDRPRPAEQQFEGSLLDFSLDAGTTAGLARLAREHRMTPYMVLLGVIGLLLYGHTHERDITLGIPVSHRNDPAFDRTVGFFVNFVVLRSRFRPELTVHGYLDEVRAACIQAFRNQDVPFDDVIQRLDLQGALSHSPLAQVVVNYHHEAPELPDFPGLGVRRESVLTGYVQTDLEFDLTVQADGSTSGTIAYAEALFDADTIGRFADRLRAFARQVVRSPDTSLGALEFRTEAEAAAVDRWNATTADFPDTMCLHEMFEAQAARTPDAPAVVHGTDTLSYRELDEQADALAARLCALGTRPDDVVGVRIDRSCELVVALMGVLKAGAAYLPLDTGTPEERVRKILADARADIVVQSATSPPPPEGVRALAPVGLGSVPAAQPPAPARPDNLVSVYYTSGSTGMPKGVASTHRGWVNRMVWMQKKHQLRPGETVLHKTTLTFDDAALEIFWPLGTGGRVAILDAGEHRDPRAVLRAAEHYRTVYLQVVPSMLIAMLDELELAPESAPRSLRNTTSSGEALYPATVERFHRLLPGLLHNTWGATEVSIDSTCHTCGPQDEAENAPVSLGLPFDNNTVHVLSAELQPVPVGVVGDLYIGGTGLARGYLNNPARTASAFVADPWNPGQRLYWTGDQGYRHPDGRVRFMGRNDHQIKIRGMRVELGEIEVTLQRHPSVRDAVVLVQGSGTALRLVAFATPVGPGATVDANDVLAHARQWLPEHMVPWRLVVMESFPLNSNGKIDRRAVTMPDVVPDVPAERLPASSSEVFVAGLWSELLDVEQIGLDDNFFTLGGHSLTATQFTARVRQRLGVDLPLVALYTDPTVSGVAERLEDLVAAQLYPADAGT